MVFRPDLMFELRTFLAICIRTVLCKLTCAFKLQHNANGSMFFIKFSNLDGFSQVSTHFPANSVLYLPDLRNTLKALLIGGCSWEASENLSLFSLPGLKDFTCPSSTPDFPFKNIGNTSQHLSQTNFSDVLKQASHQRLLQGFTVCHDLVIFLSSAFSPISIAPGVINCNLFTNVPHFVIIIALWLTILSLVRWSNLFISISFISSMMTTNSVCKCISSLTMKAATYRPVQIASPDQYKWNIH